MKAHIQFTMRELLFVVAFAGVGVASLVNGGIVGAILIYAATRTMSDISDRRTFMSLGHILIAMILGYAGAKFAVVVHQKERKD